MTPATAPTGSLRASDLRPHPCARRKTDADVYAQIARTWRSMTRGEHPARPMRMHLVAPGFAEEVWGRDDVDPCDAIAVCARVVSWEGHRLQRRARQTQLCKRDELREALDPVSSWWHPLTDAPELGIHYSTLAIVPVELQCIGRVDDPPPLRYGRFAKRDAQGPARLSVVPTNPRLLTGS